MFSTLSRRALIILATFNLSSANASNLDKSKILSFGKELNKSMAHIFIFPANFETYKT